jgi:hypothetical protein
MTWIIALNLAAPAMNAVSAGLVIYAALLIQRANKSLREAAIAMETRRAIDAEGGVVAKP